MTDIPGPEEKPWVLTEELGSYLEFERQGIPKVLEYGEVQRSEEFRTTIQPCRQKKDESVSG